jgi:hypothetical protein
MIWFKLWKLKSGDWVKRYDVIYDLMQSGGSLAIKLVAGRLEKDKHAGVGSNFTG